MPREKGARAGFGQNKNSCTNRNTEYTAAGGGLMKTTIASLPTRALSLLACWKQNQENSLGSEVSLKIIVIDRLTVETFTNTVSSMVTLSFSQVVFHR